MYLLYTFFFNVAALTAAQTPPQAPLVSTTTASFPLFNLTTRATTNTPQFDSRRIITLGFSLLSAYSPYTPPSRGCASEYTFYLNGSILNDNSGNYWGLGAPSSSDQSYGGGKYGVVVEIEEDPEEGFKLVERDGREGKELKVVYEGKRDFETFTLCDFPDEKKSTACRGGEVSMDDTLGWRKKGTERVKGCGDVELVASMTGKNFTWPSL
ncbi:MAG: hypothetical protein M1820_007479 [Bogoriella megaspora]|nr:MAG: hypothetical protein M1820_007479 [Bogoriella megaspora]